MKFVRNFGTPIAQVAACVTTLEQHCISKTAFLQAAGMVEQALKATRQSQLCSSMTDGSYFSVKPAAVVQEQQQMALVATSFGADNAAGSLNKVCLQTWVTCSFKVHLVLSLG